LELPSEVESAIVTAFRAKPPTRSALLRIAESERATNAMYSLYRIASGANRSGSDLVTPIR
jgi:hypothetical protein